MQAAGKLALSDLVPFAGDGVSFDPVEWLGRWPVTRPFGDMSFPQFGPHTGIDLGIPLGTPIPALTSGVVLIDDDDGRYDPAQPATWSGIAVRYRSDHDGAVVTCAHLQSNSVDSGDRVGAGQSIGLCGQTGAATGPHLHLEVRDVTGVLRDPIPYFEEVAMYITREEFEAYQQNVRETIEAMKATYDEVATRFPRHIHETAVPKPGVL